MNVNEDYDLFFDSNNKVKSDIIKCGVFGCCNKAEKQLMMAPGTAVYICNECYDRESVDIKCSEDN